MEDIEFQVEMDDMSELLPCGYCGGTDLWLPLETCFEYKWVSCNVCHACGPCVKTNDDAKSAWNSRPGWQQMRTSVAEGERDD